MVDGLNVHRASITNEASQPSEGIKRGSLSGQSISSPPQGKASLESEKVNTLEVVKGTWQRSAAPSKSIRPDTGVTYVRNAYLDADSDLSRLYGDTVHEPVDQLQEKTSKKQELKTEAKRHLENAGVLKDTAQTEAKRHLTNAGVILKAVHIKLGNKVSSLPGDIKTNLHPHNVIRSAKEVFNYLGGQIKHGIDTLSKPITEKVEAKNAEKNIRADALKTRKELEYRLSNLSDLYAFGVNESKSEAVDKIKNEIRELQKHLNILNFSAPPRSQEEAGEQIINLNNSNKVNINFANQIINKVVGDEDEVLDLIFTQIHLNTVALKDIKNFNQ